MSEATYPRVPDIGRKADDVEPLRADRHLHVTADRMRLVEETDPDVAFLLVAKGHLIPQADVERMKLVSVKGTIVHADSDEAKASRVGADAPEPASDEKTDEAANGAETDSKAQPAKPNKSRRPGGNK